MFLLFAVGFHIICAYTLSLSAALFDAVLDKSYNTDENGDTEYHRRRDDEDEQVN